MSFMKRGGVIQMNSDQDLRLLFKNMAYLLRLDLSNHKMYKVEELYFQEVLSFFEELVRNVESFSNNLQISSTNLSAAFAIPVLFEAADKNRELIAQFAGSRDDKQHFFAEITRCLRDYQNRKLLQPKLKGAMADFFEALANEYTQVYPFERIDYLTAKVADFGQHQYAI
jgi:hypothetical protein